MGMSLGPLGLGLTSSLVGRQVVYSAEALALFARFTTSPTEARKALINNRIDAAKASGAWFARDGFYMMAAADAQAAQRNWKADAFNLVPSGTLPPAFAVDRGYTGDGLTGYLATGFTPSTAGGQFALNSAHLSVWSRTDAIDVGVSIGSRTSAAVGQSFMTIRSTASNGAFRMNQDVSGAVPNNPNSSGGFVSRRSGSGALALFRNGASVATDTSVSTSLPTAALTIGALNTGGVIGSFNTYQFASAGYGGNLTDAQILAEYNADLAYLQGVGAIVFFDDFSTYADTAALRAAWATRDAGDDVTLQAAPSRMKLVNGATFTNVFASRDFGMPLVQLRVTGTTVASNSLTPRLAVGAGGNGSQYGLFDISAAGNWSFTFTPTQTASSISVRVGSTVTGSLVEVDNLQVVPV